MGIFDGIKEAMKENWLIRLVGEPHRAGIGQVCVQWSALESLVEAAIWQAASVRNDVGRAMTSQLMMQTKMDMLSAVLHQNYPELADPFDKVAIYICECLIGPRNAVVHGFWFENAGLAGVVKFSSKGKLTYQGRMFTVEELKALSVDIADTTEWVRMLFPRLPALQQRPGGLNDRKPPEKDPQGCATRKKLALQPLPSQP